jgi:hypothetical protein
MFGFRGDCVVTSCQQCARKSQTFICTTCQAELKQMLEGLAIGFPLDTGRRSRPWLQCLEDAALGDTRLGESARRSTDRTTPVPFGEKASDLLADVYSVLAGWFQTILNRKGNE